jgi:DNA polymerase III subunit alpha
MFDIPRFETHLHSMYSLLDGVSHPEDYVKRAAELGMPALAITDHGTLAGLFQFHEACLKHDVKPILGIEIYCAMGLEDTKPDKKGTPHLNKHHLILFAKNNNGLKNLYKIHQSGYAQTDGKNRKPIVLFETIAEFSQDLICSTACIGSPINGNEEAFNFLHCVFGEDLYLEIMPIKLDSEWDKEEKKYIPLDHDRQEIYNRQVLEYARKTGVKLLSTMDVHYPLKEDKAIQDILLLNSFGGKSGWTFSTDCHYLMSTEEMWDQYQKDAPYIDRETYEQSICNSYELLEKIGDYKIKADPKLIKFPYESHRFYEEGDTPIDLLFKTIQNGTKYKLLDNIEYSDRLAYEIEVISDKGFLDYFLIVEDIIHWARSSGMLVGPGRGSVGGSLFAYLLGIHQIDPIKYGLLFERFLDQHRCLQENMLVLTENGYKPIRDLKVGEYVLSPNGRSKIIKKATTEKETKIKISYGNDYIICSPEHKFLVNRKGKKILIMAKDLDINDDLYYNNI